MIKKFFLFLIKLYQWTISPFLGNCCRFYPTCSEYSKEAIEKFGPWKGSWLSVKRIVKCGPWCKGGFDPVSKEPKLPPHISSMKATLPIFFASLVVKVKKTFPSRESLNLDSSHFHREKEDDNLGSKE